MDSSIVFPEPWFHPWPNTSHERLASRLDNTDPLVAEALRLATRAHRGQTRRGGEPYIGHPLRVALRTAHAYPEGAGGLSRSELVAAALLHDVVEDAPWLLDELTADFPVAVADVVLLLSKVVDGTKVDPDLYWERIASSEAAWVLKAEDRIDNFFGFSQLPDVDHTWKACYLVEALTDVAGCLPPTSLAHHRLESAARYAAYHWC